MKFIHFIQFPISPLQSRLFTVQPRCPAGAATIRAPFRAATRRNVRPSPDPQAPLGHPDRPATQGVPALPVSPAQTPDKTATGMRPVEAVSKPSASRARMDRPGHRGSWAHRDRQDRMDSRAHPGKEEAGDR